MAPVPLTYLGSCKNNGIAFKRLTHWGRVTHICVGKITLIGSDNGLSPRRRQAIISTNAGILLIGPLGTNFSENLIGIQTFSFKKMPFKMSSAKWRPFCLGLNELTFHRTWWQVGLYGWYLSLTWPDVTGWDIFKLTGRLWTGHVVYMVMK